MNEHQKKADKVSTIIIDMMVISVSLLAFSRFGFLEGLKAAIPIILIGLIMTGFYFVNINSKVKALVYALLITAVALKDFFNPTMSISGTYTMILSVVIVAMYFNDRLVLLHGLILNIVAFSIYFIDARILLGGQTRSTLFMLVIVSLNGIIACLYFLNKWGLGLISISKEREREALSLVEILNRTLGRIKEGAKLLNESINVFTENINSNLSTIENVNITIQEMAKGVQHQAESISIINGNMSDIALEIQETRKLSNDVLDNSNNMMQKVVGGLLEWFNQLSFLLI